MYYDNIFANHPEFREYKGSAEVKRAPIVKMRNEVDDIKELISMLKKKNMGRNFQIGSDESDTLEDNPLVTTGADETDDMRSINGERSDTLDDDPTTDMDELPENPLVDREQNDISEGARSYAREVTNTKVGATYLVGDDEKIYRDSVRIIGDNDLETVLTELEKTHHMI